MIVKELIKELKKWVSSLEVVVDGYEGGFESVDSDSIETTLVAWNANIAKDRWWNGVHRKANYDEENPTEVLLIGRNA